MKTYSYTYIYHNYNTFVKDGKPITYGQVVLAKRDGTPFIEKITNLDKDAWGRVAALQYNSGLLSRVQVSVQYNKYGKLEYMDSCILSSDSSAVFDDDGLPL